MAKTSVTACLRSPRYWLRVLLANAGAAAAIVIITGGFAPRVRLTTSFREFEIAFLYANLIGVPAALILPQLSAVLWKRDVPAKWPLLTAAILLITAVGTTAGTLLVRFIGLVKATPLLPTLIRSFEIGAVIALLIGVSITAYELTRARLEDATVELRTRERDEAHARQLATEAQLASLESRVHPHFLFNTLNTISALIPQDPDGAERVVGRLASLLRFSLDLTPLVTIDREVQIVRDYLEIERVRFGERLRYCIELEPGAATAIVPRLSVQTLVENSVKYAVSPRREGASIAVTARANDGVLSVVVSDDGPGFGPGLPEGHGLALLKSRLISQFGERSALRIARDGTWTRVAITLPLRVEEGIA